ncbi:hypothetical protein BAME_31530 [Bacillus sp. M 2-6]|nr:hypothetical protein BAME_31530 [Bacillus sp. M 2-6]
MIPLCVCGLVQGYPSRLTPTSYEIRSSAGSMIDEQLPALDVYLE